MKGAALLFALILTTGLAAGQNAGTGMPNFGSFTPGQQIATINNQNLNVHINFPLLSGQGRGVGLSFSEVYDSQIWEPYEYAGTWFWEPYQNQLTSLGWQATSSQGNLIYALQSGECFDQYGDQGTSTTTNNYFYIDENGTSHADGAWTYDDDCGDGYSSSGPVATGDGYSVNPDTDVVTGPNGTQYSFNSSPGYTLPQVIDANGNYISNSTSTFTSPCTGNKTQWNTTDGQTVTVLRYIYTTCSLGGKSDTYQNSATTIGAVGYESLNIKTNFNCSGINEYSGTWTVPTTILTQEGYYAISYEQNPNHPGYYTGRVSAVGLPQGGVVSFAYTGPNDGINCSDGTTLSMTETVSDGTNYNTWTFSRSGSSTTVTAPQLSYDPSPNDTVYTFNSSGLETSRKFYQGHASGGTLLRTINTNWNFGTGTSVSTVTILEDSQTQSEADTNFDAYGNLSSLTEYDWGIGAHGSKLRQTTYTYVTNPNYVALNIVDLPSEVTIQDGSGNIQSVRDMSYDGAILSCPTGIVQHYDSTYPCGFYYRGDLTSVTEYLNPSNKSNPVTKNSSYDWFGNLLSAQLNCCQQKTWTYSGATNYTFPDSITSGSGSSPLTTSYTYNMTWSAVTAVKDPNNLTTQYGYANNNGQLTSVTRPDGTEITYGSGGGTVTVPLDSSHSLVHVTAFDGLGRPISTTLEDKNSNIYSIIQYEYDAVGRPYKTSNPYTNSAQYWTTTTYDAINRLHVVTGQDNSQTNYAYAEQYVTLTDTAGHQSKGQGDSAGRLVSAFEPDVSNGNQLTQQTNYTYDVFDDLKSVSEGSQTRNYLYDSLGRLTSVSIPEIGGGSKSFTYDGFNNLLTRTDTRGVVTSYTYDGLNRLIGISYPTVPAGVSSMPNICTIQNTSSQANTCIYYDQGGASAYALGKVTQVIDPSGSETHSYDNLGRVTQLQKAINGVNYVTSYAYNLVSEITQITYPSGRVVQQSFDAIGRLCEIAPSTTGCGTATTPFATGYGYSAAQQLTGFKYGNGIYSSLGFSADRLQLTCLDYSTTNRNGTCAHDGTTKFGLSYGYAQSGGNNGQIASVTDAEDNGRSASYIYDALARLTGASTAGDANYPQWGLSWIYDRYGNRLAQNISSGCSSMTCPTNSVSVNSANNQITTPGYGYDASGNMTNDGYNALVYDAENRPISATNGGSSGTYVYDWTGRRVEKTTGGATTAYIFSGSKPIAEYLVTGSTSILEREYLYSNGNLLAKVESGVTEYYHQDHLSIRMITDSSGNVVGQQGHFPYGELWYPQSGALTKWLFTSYERDNESGDDNAQARYYVSRLGRFNSPNATSGSTGAPQSLNLYAYALSDPIDVVDPSGMDCQFPDGTIPPDPLPSNGPDCTAAGGTWQPIGDPCIDYGICFVEPAPISVETDLPLPSDPDQDAGLEFAQDNGNGGLAPNLGTSQAGGSGGSDAFSFLPAYKPIILPLPLCDTGSLDDPNLFWDDSFATPEQVDAFFQSTNAPASWDGYDAGADFIAKGINPGLAVGIVGAETSFGNGNLSATNMQNPFSCGLTFVHNFDSSAACSANTVAKLENVTLTDNVPLTALENTQNTLGQVYSSTQQSAWLKNVNSWFQKFAKFLGMCQ